jgi:hypothetical protein
MECADSPERAAFRAELQRNVIAERGRGLPRA